LLEENVRRPRKAGVDGHTRLRRRASASSDSTSGTWATDHTLAVRLPAGRDECRPMSPSSGTHSRTNMSDASYERSISTSGSSRFGDGADEPSPPRPREFRPEPRPVPATRRSRFRLLVHGAGPRRVRLVGPRVSSVRDRRTCVVVGRPRTRRRSGRLRDAGRPARTRRGPPP